MSRIIALHSFRHGTGKSSLAANLAVTLAQQGYRIGIVDTSISFPNTVQAPGLYAFFGTDPEQATHTFSDYMFHRVALDEITLDLSAVLLANEQAGTAQESARNQGLFLIPFKLESDQKKSLFYQPNDLSVFSSAFAELTTTLNLDYTFIDIWPGLSEETLLPIAIADVLILTLCLDKPDFQGTAVIIDVARQLGIPSIKLAINQVIPSLDFDLLQQQIEATYNVPVIGILPFSEDLRLFSGPEPFCLHYPDHSFSQTIKGMIATLQETGQKISENAQSIVETKIATRESEISSGLSMLDILTLPDDQRQLMNWIIRQGSVKLRDVVNRIKQDEVVALSLLEQLLKQGFIQQLDSEDEWVYQPLLTSKVVKKSTRLSQDVWPSLED